MDFKVNKSIINADLALLEAPSLLEFTDFGSSEVCWLSQGLAITQ